MYFTVLSVYWRSKLCLFLRPNGLRQNSPTSFAMSESIYTFNNFHRQGKFIPLEFILTYSELLPEK